MSTRAGRLFSGARGVIASSLFYKYFDKPIERVILSSAQPIATFQNADNARNVGIELEAGQELGRYFFINMNYTFVDSSITILPELATVQTSNERALAGQSKNLFNMTFEGTAKGFAARILFNYAGDRISDVGADGAPDIFEEGRGSLDFVLSQRIKGLNVRLTMENLTDSEFLFTQGDQDSSVPTSWDARSRLSFGYNLF